MAPTLFTVAFFATLAVTGGSPLPSSKAVGGNAEQGLRGVRKLQAQPVFCSTLQCPERSTPIAAASTTECGETCDASLCCEAKCSYHQCPARSTPLVVADLIVCADLECTDDVCCEALCSYFQCPSGEVPVVDADDIVCPGLQCSAGLCCELPTNTIDTGVVTEPTGTTITAVAPTPAPAIA